jgi:hypothetical protein
MGEIGVEFLVSDNFREVRWFMRVVVRIVVVVVGAGIR